MSATALNEATPLTPRKRLARGLTYTAVGPVDITRGTVALSVDAAQSAASRLRQRYEQSRLARELADKLARELAGAQQVVASLPQALADARRPKHRSWPWIAAAGVAALAAGGGVAFVLIQRRRTQSEPPSPRPPSVEIAPKP